MFRNLCICAIVAWTLSAASARADVIAGAGTYQLLNHPDGDARPPLYGLRLDELYDVTGGHDIFTFDFEAPGANMLMDFDGTSLHIYGTVFGGLNAGSGYAGSHVGLWAVDFTYGLLGAVPGDDDLIVTTPDFTNTGTITRLATQESIPLWDYSGSYGYTFRLGDEDHDLGHRGFPGTSGWGWVNHNAQNTHVGASDWLFTVVPEPNTALLAMLGTGALLRRRHRAAR